MQIRRKPEIFFTFASYLIPPQINKSGVHLLQICSLWKNNVCFLQKSKQTRCKSICMHHCFPTFTQTTSKNFRVRFTHVTCANIYFWTKFALLPNDQICECFLTFAFGFLIVFVLMRDERSKRHLFEVTMST